MSIKSERQTQESMSRRQFVGATLAAAGAGILQNSMPGYSQPAQRAHSGMKLGLHTITFLGIWYRGRGLTLEEVIQRVDANEYKRHQAAPSLKVTPRAFGTGWRMPIAQAYRHR